MAVVQSRQVFQYVAVDGRCPFRIWFHSLRDRMAKARIRARLARVRAGNLGDAKALGGGLHELRVDHGPGYRLYFGRDGDRMVILLCGGDKSGQKSDIEAAHAMWADYGRRKDDPASILSE